MKRFNCTLSDKRGEFGECMEAHSTGRYVLFSDAEKLQQRMQDLLDKSNRTGVAIERAISTGSVLADHPLKSRLELLANHHKREQELADGMVAMAERRTLLELLLREARNQLITAMEASGEDESAAIKDLIDHIDAALDGKLPDQPDPHPDDAAVDRFSVAMKAKLAAARAKGRSGWDDPSACSVEFLADLLVNHVGKGNPGNFEDIANLAMMLHQRGADPAVLAHAATLTTCTRCEGHGMIGGVTGQTPESMDFWEAECPDCDGRGKVKVKGRTITEGQELELSTVLQSIASGFSDDPAHDVAALLKRIAGEVPWTGDSFRLQPRQADLPCNQPPSLTGQVFAGLSVAATLSGLDKASASDVARLILAAAEAKGGEPCATASPSSSKA
ncbi:hypothetical protein [Aeromonas dhakensis]|uniref:hypothetical protein n=1 Tax=Aeromonas dhakensis TaxID=196024 RepID=UPI00357157B4